MATSENHPLIAIDGAFLTDFPKTSIAIYLRSLLQEWMKLEQPPRILLCVPRIPSALVEPLLEAPNITIVIPKKPSRPASRFMALLKWHQWDIPLLLSKHRPDIYFSPFHLTSLLPRNLVMVTTVHDLCFLAENPLTLGSLIHRLQIYSACFRASRLICISNYTAAVLRRWSPVASKMTIVAQNGYRGNIISCENGFEIISKLEPQGELKSNNYFIWIGNPSPRKNIEGIMESFRKFSQEYGNQQRLVLVAPLASHERLISLAKNIGIDESMILLSDISDTTRDALYRCATALIFPSYCEGFGYPILEAMTQGCPPISSRHGPSQEIVGDTFPLSESLEPKELAVLMRYAANITVIERQEVRLKLIERAKLFSMESMATRTLQAILDAAG